MKTRKKNLTQENSLDLSKQSFMTMKDIKLHVDNSRLAARAWQDTNQNLLSKTGKSVLFEL